MCTIFLIKSGKHALCLSTFYFTGYLHCNINPVVTNLTAKIVDLREYMKILEISYKEEILDDFGVMCLRIYLIFFTEKVQDKVIFQRGDSLGRHCHFEAFFAVWEFLDVGYNFILQIQSELLANCETNL